MISKKLTCAINKQFMAQSIRPHALENDVISLQCFEVNPWRQCWMHTLCQSLWNFDPSGYDWELHVAQQHLVELAQSRYQIRPFARVLEAFQCLVHRWHIPAIFKNSFLVKFLPLSSFAVDHSHSVLGVLHQLELLQGYGPHDCKIYVPQS